MAVLTDKYFPIFVGIPYSMLVGKISLFGAIIAIFFH